MSVCNSLTTVTSVQRAHHFGDTQKKEKKTENPLFFTILNRLDLKIEI